MYRRGREREGRGCVDSSSARYTRVTQEIEAYTYTLRQCIGV